MTSKEFIQIAINCSLMMEQEMGLPGGGKTGWLLLTDRLVDFGDEVRHSLTLRLHFFLAHSSLEGLMWVSCHCFP